jgi:hypothetical protein
VLLALADMLALMFIAEQYLANIKSTAIVPVTTLRSWTIIFVVSYAFATAATINLYDYYVSFIFT